jgi:pSer/pThr/pTyr-binding forkhead associated (FHA) protein
MSDGSWLTLPDGTERVLAEKVTVGRDESNDVSFVSPTVSREHAVIRLRDGRWFVEDRGSFNGTYINGARVQPGSSLPLRHADQIGFGAESVVFSCPAELQDPNRTAPLEEVESNGSSVQLSSLQRQVVQCLCAPWLAGASLEMLPTNEEIAAELGTPGATGTVKAALRRVYAKAGLSDQPAHAKRRALCRLARQRGWV